MLNMLIAIMGDSFDHATENKVRFGTQTKLGMLSSHTLLSQQDAEETKNVFMIVVRPIDSMGFEDEDWRGTIK